MYRLLLSFNRISDTHTYTVRPGENHFPILSFDPASSFVDFNNFTKANKKEKENKKLVYASKHNLRDLLFSTASFLYTFTGTEQQYMRVY
jgi:hypothetical protein